MVNLIGEIAELSEIFNRLDTIERFLKSEHLNDRPSITIDFRRAGEKIDCFELSDNFNEIFKTAIFNEIILGKESLQKKIKNLASQL